MTSGAARGEFERLRRVKPAWRALSTAPVTMIMESSGRGREPPKTQDAALPAPAPRQDAHEEWLIDEADEESFPASDPSSIAQPHPTPRRKSQRRSR